MNWEGKRKLFVAALTIVIQVVCLWLGKEIITAELTAAVITLFDAVLTILALLGIFTPTAVSIAYMHYNVETKKLKRSRR